MGSSVFFKEYTDYQIKDIDWVVFTENYPFSTLMMKVKIKNDDIFLYRPGVTKQDFVDELKNTHVPMKAGKFLIPEFCEYIGFTIDELPSLKEYFDKMDDKHKYEQIIFESYLQNHSFTLTQEQRDKAYHQYKKYR